MYVKTPTKLLRCARTENLFCFQTGLQKLKKIIKISIFKKHINYRLFFGFFKCKDLMDTLNL